MCQVTTIIKGDQTEPAIAAASIIAKVSRDKEMILMEESFPGYGFAKHKGYPTKMHQDALMKLGVSKIHRRSFKPVQLVIQAHKL
jgi:ribonuclease HII